MKVNYHAEFIPFCVYHIFNRSGTFRDVFYEDADYNRFLSKFTKFFTPYLDTLAYCLIPNHFHFLVQVKCIDNDMIEQLKKENTSQSRKTLSGEGNLNEFIRDQLKRFLSSHSHFINTKYRIRGSLFQAKVKTTLVESEAKFWDLICYIHHNPIHHGLCKNYEDWKFSSYLNYFNDTSLINAKLIIDELVAGHREKAKNEFIKLHQDYKENFVRPT